MADKPIPLFKPMIGAAERALVDSVLESGWLTQGPMVDGFEHAMHAFLAGDQAKVGAAPYCIAVSSATAGLHIALEAAGIGKDCRVAVPTWTFTATAHAVELAGATPVFTDVDPVTLNMRPGDLIFARNIDALIPVHMAGHPIDILALSNATAGAPYRIEDCAHALSGAYPYGDPADFIGNASLSKACVYSFYASKCMTTGEGGMVITRDADMAQRLRALRYHGLSADAYDRHRDASLGYRVMGKGYKYNMNDIAAAIGVAQLGRVPGMFAHRREIAGNYLANLDCLQQIGGLPLDVPGHAWHLFIITLPTTTRGAHERPRFLAHMRDRGITCGIHYEPLHRSPYWADKYNLRAKDFPNAESVADRVVSLPIYPGMNVADQARVILGVKSYFSAGTPRPAGAAAAKAKE